MIGAEAAVTVTPVRLPEASWLKLAPLAVPQSDVAEINAEYTTICQREMRKRLFTAFAHVRKFYLELNTGTSFFHVDKHGRIGSVDPFLVVLTFFAGILVVVVHKIEIM